MSYEEHTFAERLRLDDRSVIDEIYAQYHRKIFRFAYAYLKSEDDAYDLVQDVFVKLWEHRLGIRKDTNFDAYLFSISRNSVISIFRKRMSEQKYLDSLGQSALENSEDAEDQINYSLLKKRYEQLIDQLPPKRREIYTLSKIKGLPNKQIAALQGIAEKTVEDHLSKAFSFLKQNLSGFGIWTALFYYLFVDK